jgi:anti-anti-sigma factor
LSLFRSHGCEIDVEGELVLDTVEVLESQLADAIAKGRTPIVLDFARCTYIDSSGIRALLRAHRALLGRDGGSSPALAVVGPSLSMRRALELTAIDRVIPIFQTAAEALDALAKRKRHRPRAGPRTA